MNVNNNASELTYSKGLSNGVLIGWIFLGIITAAVLCAVGYNYFPCVSGKLTAAVTLAVAIPGAYITVHRQRALERQNNINDEQRVTGQEQYQLSQKQHQATIVAAYNDRYVTGIKLLADSSPLIRSSGVNALERLADDWALLDKELYGHRRNECITILCDYLRHAPPGEEMSAEFAPIEVADNSPAMTADKPVREKILHTISIHNFTEDEEKPGLTSWTEQNTGQRMDLHDIRIAPDSSFESINLIRTNLSGAKLIRANLKGANLSGANLSGANLKGANLSGANLSGANLDGANLNDANLIGANLIGANLDGANLTLATLTEATLTGAALTEAILYVADLTGAILTEANLKGADLTGANLDGADFIGADLTGANLSLTGFKNPDLKNTDRELANLILTRAKYNSKTKFSDKIDPIKEGMINVDEEQLH